MCILISQYLKKYLSIHMHWLSFMKSISTPLACHLFIQILTLFFMVSNIKISLIIIKLVLNYWSIAMLLFSLTVILMTIYLMRRNANWYLVIHIIMLHKIWVPLKWRDIMFWMSCLLISEKFGDFLKEWDKDLMMILAVI